MAANLRLKDKVAIITGGAGGVGEATARLFAAHGAAVVIADIEDAAGLSIANSISSPGRRCTYVHCDVRDELQLAAAVDHAVRTHGRLDILFSNAGDLGTAAGILDLDMSDLDGVLAIHVLGTAAAIKHAGLAMVAAGIRGSIICTAGVAAVQGGLGPAAYSAAKMAVLGLMRSAAGELGEKGVRVNCVSPLGKMTPLIRDNGKMTAEELEKILCDAPILKGPSLTAADVAAAALFLASDESAFVTGRNVVVDGGLTTVNPFFPRL